MGKKDLTGPEGAKTMQDASSDGIEAYELPKSLVTKIAKASLPDQAKLQKETVLALVKGSTVFINYLAATAHDVANSRQHKSISASDVLKALELIEFGDIVDLLHMELQLYKDIQKSKKTGNPAPVVPKAVSSLKGKAKEQAPSSSPTPEGASSAVRIQGKSLSTKDASASVSLNVDAEMEEPEPLDNEVDVDGDGEEAEEGGSDGEDGEDEDDGDNDDDDEEQPDLMAVEEEEMRNDELGLERGREQVEEGE